MSKYRTRRSFLTGATMAALIGSVPGAGFAEAPARSKRPVARPGSTKPPSATSLIEAAGLGGSVGFAVVDVATGSFLEGYNPTAGLPPASVAKAVTGLYGLRVLGPEYRFKTRLISAAPPVEGVIKGDLVLAGGGDPLLDTDALAQMADDLKALGVHRVEGKFRVYGGGLPYVERIDEIQPVHASYNPAVSGLNLNFNRVHFEWKRTGQDYEVTMDARSGAHRPAVRVARMGLVERRSPLYTYRNEGDHDTWTVAEPALGNGGARWLPVRHPARYAGEVFASFARSHGIILDPGAALDEAPEGHDLVTHESDMLREIVRDMMKYSTNLTAELIGMTATAKRNGLRPESLRGSAAVMTRWAQEELGLRDARFVDHSGLGDESSIEPGTLARALAEAEGEKLIAPLMKPIALRDGNGRIDRDHKVKVFAKTGTLVFVSALAGYATAPDGRRLAFAIFTANEEKRLASDRATQDSPPGAAAWNRRAKKLQQALIERWVGIYAS
ncbi:D-alanyl-D-alanine carboxypeptidase/D-alanyl-D-alanine-endopeptidase [Roseovarius sp. C7]|uniref:D-alanyl-D-alanine carboxypeptidase/D-alanyl-D-alanine endopeptidase n=1 Tax=Roseovarius sp. C7 TaxID=3398643 RepID=UPI0039F6EA67